MKGLLSMAMGMTLLTATGCGGGGPYDVGLIVKSTVGVQSTTKSYREVVGKGVQESIGVVGSGSVCSDAMASAGKTGWAPMLKKLAEPPTCQWQQN